VGGGCVGGVVGVWWACGVVVGGRDAGCLGATGWDGGAVSADVGGVVMVGWGGSWGCGFCGLRDAVGGSVVLR